MAPNPLANFRAPSKAPAEETESVNQEAERIVKQLTADMEAKRKWIAPEGTDVYCWLHIRHQDNVEWLLKGGWILSRGEDPTVYAVRWKLYR